MKLRGCMFLFLLSVPLGAMAAASGTLQGVKTSVDAQGTTLLLRLSGPVKYSPSQAGPRLYLLDLTGVSAQTAADRQPVQSPLVSSYRLFSYHGADDQPHVGVEISLKENADVQTKQVPGGVQIRVRPAGEQASSPAPAAASLRTPAPAEGSSPSQAASLLKEVSVVQPEKGDGVDVEIVGDGQLSYRTYRLSKPDRLVLDLSNTVDHSRQSRLAVNTAVLQSVRIAQFRNQPPISRVVMDLDRPVSFEVRSQGNGLVVSLSPKSAVEASAPLNRPDKAQVNGGASQGVAAKSQPSPAPSVARSALTAKTRPASRPAHPANPPAISDPQPVLLASNGAAGANLSGPLSSLAPIANSLPAAPLAPETPPEAKSEASPQSQPAAQQETASASAPSATAEPAPAPAAPSAEATATAPEPLQIAAAATPVLLKSDTNATVKAPAEAAGSEPAGAPSNQQPPLAVKPALLAEQQARVSPTALRESKAEQASLQCLDGRYTGEPVSLNLKDVDLKDFFRLMHEVSGLNVVLDPNVSGSVTVVLDQVPWDQAMDIVDKNNALDCTRTGNVIRIAKVSTIEAEAKEQLAKAQAEEQEEKEGMPLQIMTRTLSYATAQTLIKPLQAFLSPRGSVVVDPRTNMVIVKDIPANLENISSLLDKMDRRTQQVEIEARIVSATRSFAQDIGSQLATSGLSGNVTLGGTGEVGTSPISRGTTPPLFIGTPPTTPGTYADLAQPLETNLPAVAPTSGLSLLLTSGKFALDEIITAAESKGIGKLLSRPKIITQNNVEATVQQGVEIPIQTNINNTITVQYVNVVLRMTVTPQITAEGTIFLKINIENTSIDNGIPAINGMPALDTQSATTNVLVSDGGTVFFGGIIQTNNQISINQVPLLGDIPLLGNLFKEKSTSSTNNELLFFITPKITQS